MAEVKQEILKIYKSLATTAGGSPHAIKARKLNRLCLDNPQAVASIAFDKSILEDDKLMILFTWSKDHSGSCEEKVNYRWCKMMRNYIIPDMDKLPFLIRDTADWYRRVHGL